MRSIPKIRHARGRVSVPPSKSYTVRALLLAASTEGETTVLNPLDSDDPRYLIEALRRIGFDIRGSFAEGWTIGNRRSMSAGEVEISIGNAGTAMRFLTGFLSFTPGRFLLTGDSRMLERPIGDLVDALVSIGAEIEYTGKPGFPPLGIRGRKMRGGFEIRIAGDTSSQFVSSVMMAGATLPSGLDVRVKSLSSEPYVDMTRSILEAFGARIEKLDATLFRVHGGTLRRDQYIVEADFSSASYWLAAAMATAGEVELTGLARDSAQGDRGFVDMLVEMGGRAGWSDDGVLRFQGAASMRGGTFDCNRTPDIVPTLAAIAPLAQSPVEITNIANLRVKESDRIAALASELKKLGASVDEQTDGLRISPGWPDSPALIDSHGDHRIAMSFAIAGLARGGITIVQEQVVSKSYPRFWRSFDELVASSEKW